MSVNEEKFFRSRIVARKDFAPDLWSIRIDPGAEFPFVAGQYATLCIETPAKLVQKPYSIVSSPYEKEIEFFFELVPDGEMTPLLHKLPSGAEVLMRKVPKGHFTIDFKSGHTNHFLAGTVTGAAPYVSYFRTLYRDWRDGKFPEPHRFFLINGASRSWEMGYLEEVEKMAAEVPWLKSVHTVSRPWEDEKWRGETGRVDDLIRKYTDMWGLRPTDTTAYLCGHPDMIQNGKGILKRAGWAKESMREEVYWIPGKSDKA